MVSFHVNCGTKEEVDAIWDQLSPDAKVLMPLDPYPFSPRYGWLQDRYGLSWQITPDLMQELLGGKDKKRIERITQAFLKMRKFDLAALKRAAEG